MLGIMYYEPVHYKYYYFQVIKDLGHLIRNTINNTIFIWREVGQRSHASLEPLKEELEQLLRRKLQTSVNF